MNVDFMQLLAVAGPPYDTLEEVIGIRGSPNVGSLKDFGVTYREVPVREFLPSQPHSAYGILLCVLWGCGLWMITDEASVIACSRWWP